VRRPVSPRATSSSASDPKWFVASRVVCTILSGVCCGSFESEAIAVATISYGCYHQQILLESRPCLDATAALLRTETACTPCARHRGSTYAFPQHTRTVQKLVCRLSAASHLHRPMRDSCVTTHCPCGRSVSQSTAAKRPRSASPRPPGTRTGLRSEIPSSVARYRTA
jgi:hypothetical protein